MPDSFSHKSTSPSLPLSPNLQPQFSPATPRAILLSPRAPRPTVCPAHLQRRPTAPHSSGYRRNLVYQSHWKQTTAMGRAHGPNSHSDDALDALHRVSALECARPRCPVRLLCLLACKFIKHVLEMVVPQKRIRSMRCPPSFSWSSKTLMTP